MKSNTKTKVPTLSRQSQKTLIIIAALAYLMQSVMIGQFFYSMLTEGFPNISTYVLYPITVIALPVLSFVLIYLISGPGYTKLWRACQAALVAFLAVIAEGFLSALNLAVFSNQLGYVEAPASEGSQLLLALPLVLTLAVVAVAGVWLRRRKKSRSGEASSLFQKGFIVLLPLLTLGQIAVTYFGYTSGGALGQSMDSGVLMGALSSLVIPAIAWAILFLLTSRLKTALERTFTSLVYLIIGVLIFMACMLLAYLTSSMGGGLSGGEQNIIVNLAPPLFALTLFAGLVAWHKKKRFL